jgi:hypothetical protein
LRLGHVWSAPQGGEKTLENWRAGPVPAQPVLMVGRWVAPGSDLSDAICMIRAMLKGSFSWRGYIVSQENVAERGGCGPAVRRDTGLPAGGHRQGARRDGRRNPLKTAEVETNQLLCVISCVQISAVKLRWTLLRLNKAASTPHLRPALP